MFTTKDLKKIKIIFKHKGKEINKDYFEILINNTKDKNEINFFRGCKHILEKHYTEAIKWFQLTDNYQEAVLLILILSIKLGDSFLFDEYYSEDIRNFPIFEKYDIYPFVKNGEEKLLDINVIKNLKAKLW